MNEDTPTQIREMVDAIYRSESRQVLATLIRLLGDFETAEEALHDAFAVAVEQWARDGVPANPRAWLVSTGRFKAIDKIRRPSRFVSWDAAPEVAGAVAAGVTVSAAIATGSGNGKLWPTRAEMLSTSLGISFRIANSCRSESTTNAPTLFIKPEKSLAMSTTLSQSQAYSPHQKSLRRKRAPAINFRP